MPIWSVWLDFPILFNVSYIFLTWPDIPQRSAPQWSEPYNDSEVGEGVEWRRGCAGSHILALGHYGSRALLPQRLSSFASNSLSNSHVFSAFNLKLSLFHLLLSFSLALGPAHILPRHVLYFLLSPLTKKHQDGELQRCCWTSLNWPVAILESNSYKINRSCYRFAFP